jgi:LPXTG-site transpeptidase (sortase) family protein
MVSTEDNDLKYKIPIFSTIALFALTVCMMAIVFVGGAGWLLTGISDETRKETRSQVPLPTIANKFTPASTPIAIVETESPPTIEKPTAESTITMDISPTLTIPVDSEPTEIPIESSDEVLVDSSVATPDEVTKQLGFHLPVGSINSVTQEGVATRLVIPKLNVDAPVVIAPIRNGTWDVEHLGQTLVGHLEGTAPPGSASNIVLAAHVTLDFNVYGPFAGLSLLEEGDELIVYENDRMFRYEVSRYYVVDRSNVDVAYPSDEPEITLITCSRWNREAGRYLDRLVVKGKLVAE